MFFDHKGCCEFLTQAADQYEKSTPAVYNYIDDLYRRLNSGKPVLLAEIVTVCALKTEHGWEPSHFAQNRIYHFTTKQGIQTDGLINDW